jgi:hypothetical protein
MLICHCNLITEKEIEQTILSCSKLTPGNSSCRPRSIIALRSEVAVAAASQMWSKRSFEVTEVYHALGGERRGHRFTPGPRERTAVPIREQEAMKGDKQVIERLNEALFLELALSTNTGSTIGFWMIGAS